MKINLILILLFFSNCVSLPAQNYFENGTITLKDQSTVTCEIEYQNWDLSPTSISFRTPKSKKITKVSIQEVEKFSVGNYIKFENHTVEIDTSSYHPSNYSKSRKPKNIIKEVFLRKIIEGDFELLQYQSKSYQKFYLKTHSTGLVQLIYKPYQRDSKQVFYNETFKTQLQSLCACEGMNDARATIVKYSKKSMIDFLEEFAKCNSERIVLTSKIKKFDLFNIIVKPSLRSSNLILRNSTLEGYDYNLPLRLMGTIGIEVEFVVPSSEKQWSFFVEPTYNRYSFTTPESSFPKVLFKYNSIEVPLGSRYYFNLNDNSQISLEGTMFLDFPFSSASSIQRDDFTTDFKLDVISFVNFGSAIGYRLLNNFSVQFRYSYSRQLYTFRPSWNAKYHTYSLLFGYSFY